MSGKKLFKAMRNIDAQLILDAAPGEWAKRHKGGVWLKWGALAAGLCALMFGVFYIMLLQTPDIPQPDESTPPQGSKPPIAEHVHAFGEWYTTKQATCSEMGEEARLCACGEKETRTIAKLPVENPEQPDEPNTPADPEQPETDDKEEDKSPVTGDAASVMLWAVVMMMAVAVVIVKRKETK